MQNETNHAFAQATSTAPRTPTALPASRRFSPVVATKTIVIVTMLTALLGMEVKLRIAPQLGIVGNVATVWLVWGLLGRPT